MVIPPFLLLRRYASVQHLHGLAAAPGDYIARLDVEQLVADGAVDVAFFFGPYHRNQAAFQFVFHRNTLLIFSFIIRKSKWSVNAGMGLGKDFPLPSFFGKYPL